jgi:hypothetical protein
MTLATSSRSRAAAFDDRRGRRFRREPLAVAEALSEWTHEGPFDDETVKPSPDDEAGAGIRLEVSAGAPATLDRPPLARLHRRPVRSRRQKRPGTRAGGGDDATNSWQRDEGADERGLTLH